MLLCVYSSFFQQRMNVLEWIRSDIATIIAGLNGKWTINSSEINTRNTIYRVGIRRLQKCGWKKEYVIGWPRSTSLFSSHSPLPPPPHPIFLFSVPPEDRSQKWSKSVTPLGSEASVSRMCTLAYRLLWAENSIKLKPNELREFVTSFLPA